MRLERLPQQAAMGEKQIGVAITRLPQQPC